MFGLSELAVVLVVVIAVLSAKRLPDLVRSAGKSARILKAEARALKEEKEREEAASTDSTEAAAPPRVVPGELTPPSPGAGAPGGAPHQAERRTPPSAP
ncbi:twin-arginine translocase TatA/TatE family subunit [Streptomyces sp. NPDC056600]|uniref:twin-arginine translocase TatA/TatE family subunit n=1 Tax=Streptomyces sp. NPDC056600 TaxID=3345874 RepID=UPI0036B556D1